ncbi:MAG: histidine triad nucleotide-binding protein [Thermoguttaceae bacterium]|nr:histidine triad nucleotide-binding protein [Thermoguttaceae bacterium]MDW8036579.1 histidine triad nucleotide-binding protein [Thermoguttaceae bacterium]
MSTVFKKIIDRQIPADIVYEDEQSMVFKDIHPQAPVHLIVIPKKEIPTLNDLTEADEGLIGHLFVVIARVAKQLGLTGGYRVVVNCGPEAGQEVMHLHFHLLGGRSFGWPPG